MAIANTRPGGYPASARGPPSGGGGPRAGVKPIAVGSAGSSVARMGPVAAKTTVHHGCLGTLIAVGSAVKSVPPYGLIAVQQWAPRRRKVNPAAIRPVGMAAMFSLSANSGPALPRRARCGNPGVDLESQLSNGPQARVRVDGVGNHRLAVRP